MNEEVVVSEVFRRLVNYNEGTTTQRAPFAHSSDVSILWSGIEAVDVMRCRGSFAVTTVAR